MPIAMTNRGQASGAPPVSLGLRVGTPAGITRLAQPGGLVDGVSSPLTWIAAGRAGGADGVDLDADDQCPRRVIQVPLSVSRDSRLIARRQPLSVGRKHTPLCSGGEEVVLIVHRRDEIPEGADDPTTRS
jgi:hypothetical protein